MILNAVNQQWNDYGYAKERIWSWTLGLFVFFWIINWFFLRYFFDKVYISSALVKVYGERRARLFDQTYFGKRWVINLRGLDIAMYYTATIFFGIKLDAKNFHFNNLRGVIYIGCQYVVGLICLGYLANFVINSGIIGA